MDLPTLDANEDKNVGLDFGSAFFATFVRACVAAPKPVGESRSNSRHTGRGVYFIL